MTLSLELTDIFCCWVIRKQPCCMPYCFSSFSCKSMPRSGCSTLHGVSLNKKEIISLMLETVSNLICHIITDGWYTCLLLVEWSIRLLCKDYDLSQSLDNDVMLNSR